MALQFAIHLEAWKDAGRPCFGIWGHYNYKSKIDLDTAKEIDKLYEVLIALEFLRRHLNSYQEIKADTDETQAMQITSMAI